MRSDEVFIRHILDEINFLVSQTKAAAYEQFLEDETLKRAAARSLEIIGEAAKRISSGFKKRHEEIDWKGMAGLRDVLIHRYFEVDWEIFWDVVKRRLPELQPRLENILKDIEAK